MDRSPPGICLGQIRNQAQHLSSNGFLHAASVVALLDTACGFGCLLSIPEGASNFTTLELKANMVGTARAGGVSCEARMMHSGRLTQVWDAEARAETSNKIIAYFRCTQMILYPRSSDMG